MHEIEYAIYRGDEFLCIGTRKECAEWLGTTESHVQQLLSPVRKERISKVKNPRGLIAVKLD